MNKVEARSPIDQGNWQAIDIYLFSNGQQYSPPRKYHLQSEDLHSSDSTLNYLARSQYESLHKTIDLYSIDGRKINGPLELRDGMPYVAVVPPDAFINSGYDKYLMRASRSWEKRQAKKTSIVDQSDSVRTVLPPGDQEHQPVMLVYTTPKLTTIKTPDKNITEESALVRPQRNSTPKSDRSETQPPLKDLIAPPRSSNPHPHRNENRLSGQQTTFVKTGIPSVTQPRKNSVLKGKEGFHRQKLTKPNKINELVNGAASKPKRLSKTPQNPPPVQQPVIPTPPSLQPSSPEPTIPDTLEHEQEKSITVLHDKNLETDSAALDHLMIDKDIVVIAEDVRKGIESEIRTIHLDRNPATDEIISCYMVTSGVEEGIQTHTNQATAEVNTTDAGVNRSLSIVKVIPATLISQTNTISYNIPLKDNFIAVINKGDAVNLNLTIDLQNNKTSDAINGSTLDHRAARKVSSLVDIFEKAKGSPNCKDEETMVQAKSLQSVNSSVNNCFAKVVVVQCACCGNNASVPRIDAMPVYKNENGFFILMPSPPSGGNDNCTCGPNCESICLDKNMTSEFCLADLIKTKSAEYPVVTRDVGVVMTIMNCELPRMEEWQKNVYNSYTMNKVSINEDRCSVECCCPSPSQEVERFEQVAAQCENQRPQERCNTAEAYAQTDWCRILLQARREADGHYSFHLPPLELLKYYTI